MKLEDAVKNSAIRMGFDLVAISSSRPLIEDKLRYDQWKELGYAGEMAYMIREYPRRWEPRDLLPEAKSVITFMVNFFSSSPRMEPRRGFGRIARYAWGKDYHIVIRKRLEEWTELLPEICGRKVSTKILVDSGPLLERAFAGRGGAGFVGKNTLIISRKLGSFVFLSEVLTDLELSPDEISLSPNEGKDACGSCRECLADCPTGALTAPRKLDARKCISYWTIENRGGIPLEMRPRIGDWIFGCDICQDVCPYNVLRKETSWKEFLPEAGTGPYLSLLEALSLETEDQFRSKFRGTPVLRAKRMGLVRNACVVSANQGFCEARPFLDKLAMRDSDPIVREHAEWALNQLPLR